MHSWPSPAIPEIPGRNGPIHIFDSAHGEVVALTPGPTAGLYVCGITPYDATHLGHAATYVTFDVLGRALRDAGHDVVYVQNVTDVDDPLLARAVRDGIDWEVLADRETALFREDMTALGVIAPDHYLGVTESIDGIVATVSDLLAAGTAYRLEAPDASSPDIYLDLAQAPGVGSVSHASREEMLALFAERGGDPEREGKRDALDPLLWRGARDGEPSWDGGDLGDGRPGWHIECTVIALANLDLPMTVQGGGTDLIYPHHEMSAAQGRLISGEESFAQAFVHQAMVGFEGEKMSKSKGNLVLVSRLRADGVDPMAIRLALLDHHYRTEWEWSDGDLTRAQERLGQWRAALSRNGGPSTDRLITTIRARVSDDLDTPGALVAMDKWVAESLSADHSANLGGPGLAARAIDRLLGVRL
ncbi:MAG: cysteine--1-D-myo-inosityl 2-amino-2-deoxy-alpha-D-glucopyranoside ligase [Dermatophilaceae bacterium]|nr:cysteine--1-D-myo-inosityl 2-amino-2-deoxy-alpha-D-glucopyranoside ligase [Actinomycetales bacterium]MBP8879972.1 cysteine--1-D-myo-inosityl 2-amino-2-deoxy-alpha-D-glucopyranoside ligase [Dermatophilaceae bacterium]MBP9917071.1 cysteine--1-D-myo-inosityl 2-amino-2-deoxy-alpha-D-glucopyranoside ligase [Dermatophilaceae bacterium]